MIGLDDYTLELKEQVASLRAQNDLYEFEEIGQNADQQMPMYERCIEAMLEFNQLKKQLGEAKKAAEYTYAIDDSDDCFSVSMNTTEPDTQAGTPD